MNSPQFPHSRFRFTECDQQLLETLQSFLASGIRSFDSSRDSDPAFEELLENVWIDPSLQGWSPETFDLADETEAVKIEDLILPELGGKRPWDGAADKEQPVLYLGLYSGSPRRIILFPNAIEMVAGSKRFRERYPAPLQKRIDLLTKVVLIHESVHWFTLDPEKHKARWNLQGRDPVQFTELVETLAELISWLAFSCHAKHKPEVSRELLRVQYLSNDPAGGYEYQLYWFWLVLSGLADRVEHLDGTKQIDGDLPEFQERLEAFARWAMADQLWHENDDAHLLSRTASAGFKSPEEMPDLLPGFLHFKAELSSLLAALWKVHHRRIEKFRGLGDQIGRVEH